MHEWEGERKLDKVIVEIVAEHKEELTKRWKKNIISHAAMNQAQDSTSDLYNQTNDDFLELIYAHISKEVDESNDKVLQFAERLINFGWDLSFITQGLQTFRRTLLDVLFEKVTLNERALEVYQQVDRWLDPLMNELINATATNWEHTVSLQKVALKELTAPLIPVFQHISVMPLVGTIDTERAKLIMENLLQGVIGHRAQVVLIDITGVPVVDTMVAHHIIQAAEAVRLIGATCILVGIRPEIAQTIVNLGIDLKQFPTKNTLYNGIKTALQMTNRQIVEL